MSGLGRNQRTSRGVGEEGKDSTRKQPSEGPLSLALSLSLGFHCEKKDTPRAGFLAIWKNSKVTGIVIW